jgi:lipopolysaccharide export system protein LptA
MNRLTAGLLCAGAIALCAPAMAQLAQGKGPIDITGDEAEVINAQHLTIWRGSVDAIQGQDRLRTDVLNVYFTGKPGGDSTPSKTGALGGDWGKIDHMVADGHVYYVSPQQNARSDHAVYELGPDTITMTGDVIVEQGQSVVHGEKLVIDVHTGHATMVAARDDKAPSGRVRGVFYPNENSSSGGSAPGGGTQ